MRDGPAVLSGQHFLLGDQACAEGALAAGCRFFAGYPITPSTEITEHLARRLPEVQGIFVQMEDELASMAAIVGASVAGARAMTATSGPGFSLMMENLGLAAMMEVPCVVVNVQRGGPSTGLPTLVGQADVMQARWGSHGDYEIVAYAPASPQECFDLTLKAFNTADRFRIPTLVLADEVVGHMTERVTIPPAEAIPRVERKRPRQGPEENGFLPFRAEEDLIPPMVHAGEGYRVHFTGLTHDERGYPVTTGPAHHQLSARGRGARAAVLAPGAAQGRPGAEVLAGPRRGAPRRTAGHSGAAGAGLRGPGCRAGRGRFTARPGLSAGERPLSSGRRAERPGLRAAAVGPG